MKPLPFNRDALEILPLLKRNHDLDLKIIKQLGTRKSNQRIDENILPVAAKLVQAHKTKAAIALMMGAHVIRSGVQNYLIDLMERGYISCIAMNGAGMIHDFEFALVGATTESVAHYIQDGRFGLWKETGLLNDIINQAYRKDSMTGMGEAVGQAIAKGDFPHKDISILAAGYRFQVPITIHVGVGYDIIHQHPNCDGAATGALSYNDFLLFASVIGNLEGGVVMDFGSAVMAPEVFLKALSMARNLARQEGKTIKRFTSLVCDLYDLPDDFSKESAKENPAYYFRPWKTMLIRTVVDGGRSFYIKGSHDETIPALWAALNKKEKEVR